MKTDSEIERDVKAELGWNSDLKSTDIAISVKNGVVTLAGFVPRYIDKYEAEKAAKRVAGVLAVANDIEIRLPAVDERPDPEIAREVVTALKNQLPFSHERIKAVVRNGWVTLEGDVEWQYQRLTAERAVRPLKGVKGIINDIKTKPRVEPSDIKQKSRRPSGAVPKLMQIRSPSRRAAERSYSREKCVPGSSAMKPNEWPGGRPESPRWTIASW